MRLGLICAAGTLMSILSGCVSLPPYEPKTAQTQGDWKACQHESADAYYASGNAAVGILGGPVVGAVAASQFDHDSYIRACMSRKGYSLPPGYNGSAG